MVAVALRSVSSVTVTFEVPSVGPTVKGGIMADALIRVGGLLLITPRPRFARTHVIARSIAFWGAATTTESAPSSVHLVVSSRLDTEIVVSHFEPIQPESHTHLTPVQVREVQEPWHVP